MEDEERQKSIWLEVSNVRGVEGKVEIQVKGDKDDRGPVWRMVQPGAYFGFDKPETAFRTLTDGLDKKRTMLAQLAQKTGKPLECTAIRIQYAESNSR